MDAKVTLGLGGVAVVLGAVLASIGLFSYAGVPTSVVVLQVVPFLVLAVGADNVFIFVLEHQVGGRRPAPGAPSQTPPSPVGGSWAPRLRPASPPLRPP